MGTTSLSNRPELRELRWQRREAEVDLALGRNQMLPGLNAAFESSQDVGRAASSKRDKSPFELEAGILLDVPLQRRKARGKIMESQGKIAQLMAKQRFTEDKIAIQVRDGSSDHLRPDLEGPRKRSVSKGTGSSGASAVQRRC
ncbi:MAG: TolC family protein [Planctomycetota bacterium]|nr:TolC family protein [Planctomycetota bacterium]